MSKTFICNGCKEKYDINMQSSNTGYCYICNEFYMKQQLAYLESKLAESENEKERIKKNWRISRTQQQKLYENLKQENKKAGVVNYPIVLDGCRISNEEQLLDFAKDFVLEKAYWQEQLAEKQRKIKGLGLYTKNVIDFAVEQLEKVKDATENILDKALKNSSYNQKYYDELLDQIDNQIKQLKEGK